MRWLRDAVLELQSAALDNRGKGSQTIVRLNAMCQRDQDIEDRIFELLGEMKTPLTIIRELDLGVDEGYALIRKVIKERDTPNAIKLRKTIERMAAVRI